MPARILAAFSGMSGISSPARSMVVAVTRSRMSRKVSGDADDGGEAEVGLAEFFEAVDDGLGGGASDATVPPAVVFPGEAERFVGLGVVDFPETDGLSVSAFGGDEGKRLLTAGDGHGFVKGGGVFHKRRDRDGWRDRFCSKYKG